MLRLSKYFYLIGIPIMLMCIVLLTWMYHRVTMNELLKQSENNNIFLARSMANVVWPQVSGIVKSVNTQSQQLKPGSRAHFDSLSMINIMLDEPIHEVIKDTNVLKVKLFNTDGLTIYSTLRLDIGEREESQYPPIVNARQGRVTTEAQMYDRFVNNLGNTVSNRYVLSSYLPIYSPDKLTIDGIFEIYTDVTDIYESLHYSQFKVAIVLTIVFLILFTMLHFLMRHIAKLIEGNFDLGSANDNTGIILAEECQCLPEQK